MASMQFAGDDFCFSRLRAHESVCSQGPVPALCLVCIFW